MTGARSLARRLPVGGGSAAFLAAFLCASCGGAPPVDPKDEVKSVSVTIRFRPGVAGSLGLPASFLPLETGRRTARWTLADRGTCRQVQKLLSAVKPRSSPPAPDGAGRQPTGEILVRTGWGKEVRMRWLGARFELDGRAFESSQLSRLLASAVARRGPGKAP